MNSQEPLTFQSSGSQAPYQKLARLPLLIRCGGHCQCQCQRETKSRSRVDARASHNVVSLIAQVQGESQPLVLSRYPTGNKQISVPAAQPLDALLRLYSLSC